MQPTHGCSTTARRRSGSRAAGTASGWPTPSATASRTRIEAFGGQLVVWEDTQGNLNVLDGYCRHMGGDLTQGTVKGDEIACPFHDWRWGGDGKCKQIPYARRVPLRARTQKYPAVDPQRPAAGLARRRGLRAGHATSCRRSCPGSTTGSYTDWTWEVVPITDSHCRELIDNVVDMAHFYYVHFAFPTSFRNVFEGTQATQFMESKGRPDKAGGVRRARTCSSSPRRPTTDRRT